MQDSNDCYDSEAPSPGDPAPRSVLVVDDDASVLETTEDLLSEAGFEVLTAGSVDDALALAREQDCGVVLTDVQMPGKGGLELLAELRELRPTTPVLLMTGYGSIRSAVAAMRAGALDYVTKPFDTEELLVSLERAFERRALETENLLLRRAVERASGLGEPSARARR